jgi:8-amino-7-oxononanoate synthase
MSLFYLKNKLGRVITLDNKEFLYFSGTDYLGMSAHPDFQKLIVEGFSELGTNHGLSRINNVRMSTFEEFENQFAIGAGAEKALVWSSGYLAGQATLSYLLESTDYIFVSPDTHPAILPEELKPKIKQTFADWQREVEETCEQLKPQKILILSNSVNPLKPAVYDFSWIGHLPRKHEYKVLLDDSHAFGVTGTSIYGNYSKWKYLPVDLFVTGSLGKGLGMPAGISLGLTFPLIDIANQRVFRGASPPPPAYLYAFLKSQLIYEVQKSKLLENIQYFQVIAANLGTLDFNPNFPIFLFKDNKWVKKLEEAKIIVSSFPYPAPTDPWINRIVVAAYHTKGDLSLLGKTLQQIKDTKPITI